MGKELLEHSKSMDSQKILPQLKNSCRFPKFDFIKLSFSFAIYIIILNDKAKKLLLIQAVELKTYNLEADSKIDLPKNAGTNYIG